jgi:MerR family transcriptional regulator, light-induced transcriptional regulator
LETLRIYIGDIKMVDERFLQRYMQSLLTGDRASCRTVIEEILQNGLPVTAVYLDVIWPIMLEIDKLYRANTITSIQEHLATRINRTIVDQLQNKLPRKPEQFKNVVICTAGTESGELGGQIIADMFESSGWCVRFLGGGLNNDEILAFVHEFSPDVLVIYGTIPQQAPAVRQIIDKIRDVNAWPDMKIMLSGGVFARAEGLWEEIGADLFATTAIEAVELACDEKQTKCQPVRTINRRKRNAKAAKTKESAECLESTQ